MKKTKKTVKRKVSYKQKPLVSVIMPVYNSEKYLDKAIQSILNQTYTNFEFIIIDDCSKDKSWNIIQKYAKKDKRIKAVRNKENLNVVKTRNKGFSLISKKSEFIAIMDADDISVVERIEKQVKFFEENKDYYLIGSHNIIIDEKDEIIGRRTYPLTDNDVRKVFTKYDPLSQPTAMMRTKILKTVGKYNEKYNRCQDYDLWFRIADKYKVGNVDDYLLKYRISKTQGKTTHLKETIRNTVEIQGKWVFDKRYFSIGNYLFFLAEHIAALFPSLTLKLFKKVRYKN